MLKDFFALSSPADYAKKLINTRTLMQRNCSRDRRQNIKFKRQNKRNEWNRKKKNKNADETLKIIKACIKSFQLAWKIDKGKSESKPEESIAERTILRKGMVVEIEKEEKNKQ